MERAFFCEEFLGDNRGGSEAGYYVKPGEQPTMMWKNFMSAENNYQRGGLFGYYLPEQVEKM